MRDCSAVSGSVPTLSDLATAWEQHGEAALARTAVEYPDRFVGICAHLLPKDVSVSLSARVPGNLEPDDWSIALATFEAIKRALPDASERSPGQVLDFVLDAIRQGDAKPPDRGCTEKPLGKLTLKHQQNRGFLDCPVLCVKTGVYPHG